ncbi:hypothetical protein VPH35_106311 [Triticum aestivum]
MQGALTVYFQDGAGISGTCQTASRSCTLGMAWVEFSSMQSCAPLIFSHRYWLSNLGCNPSACRHNQQNKAATMICPLISWSDSNLQAPGKSNYLGSMEKQANYITIWVYSCSTMSN